MTYESRKKKISGFSTDDAITSASTFDFIKDGINKKTSWSNILDKFSEVYGLGARIFDTEADIIASDIQIDEHAIVVSNNYGLYKITSLAAGGQDVTLTSGFVATLQSALDVPNPADYTELRAITTAGLLDGTPITVTDSGIAGDFVLVNSIAHGLTDNGGTIIVINANWYAKRKEHDSGVYQADWFGTTYDGITDDAEPINRCIDYLATRGTGEVIFSANSYAVSEHVHLRTGITYTGAGVGKTIILAHPDSTDNVIGHSGPEWDFDIFDVHIRDMTIDGNRSNVDWNLEFEGDKSDDAFQNGIRLFKCKNWTIKNVEIQNAVFNGLSIYFLSSNGVASDVEISGIGKSGTPPVGSFATYCGIFVEYAGRDITLINPKISDCREIGLLVQTATDGGVSNVKIYNPIIKDTYDSGIKIKDQGVGGVGPLYDISVFGGLVENACTGVTDAAIRVERMSSPTVDALDILIDGTYVINSNYIGVLLNTGTARCKLNNVRVYGSANKGIIDAGVDNEIVSCISLSNAFDNLDITSSSRNRLVGGQFLTTGPNNGQTGTFTPVVNFGGASTGVTYASRSGAYKIDGGWLEFSLSIVLSSKGSDTGNLTISGLPYTSKSSSPLSPCVLSVANVTYSGEVFCLVLNSSSVVDLYYQVTGGASTHLDDTHIANNSEFYLSGKFPVNVY